VPMGSLSGVLVNKEAVQKRDEEIFKNHRIRNISLYLNCIIINLGIPPILFLQVSFIIVSVTYGGGILSKREKYNII
jgi:hypothetical protein